MNVNSFMHFQVGPEVVQGGPLLVQPRVSSTVQHLTLRKTTKNLTKILLLLLKFNGKLVKLENCLLSKY